MSGNFVDLIIAVVFLFFLVEGYRFGFWTAFFDFISFFLTLVLSLILYKPLSDFIGTNFGFNSFSSNAISFILAAIAIEIVFFFTFSKLATKIPENLKFNKYLKFLSVFPALGEALVLVSFFLTLILSFPVSPKVKVAIASSKAGGFLIQRTSYLETKLNEVFGGAEGSLLHLTIKPDSGEVVALDVETLNLSIDELEEEEMFALINKERKSAGVNELAKSIESLKAAHGHGEDMWTRKYFGHTSPEGENVGDRLKKTGVKYQIAGENLALAPSVAIAFEGLMNSKEHRENLLSPDFNKVSVGVIDNGFYGKIYVQVFTD